MHWLLYTGKYRGYRVFWHWCFLVSLLVSLSLCGQFWMHQPFSEPTELHLSFPCSAKCITHTHTQSQSLVLLIRVCVRLSLMWRKSKRYVTTENPIEPHKRKTEGQIEDRREIQGVESGERDRKESEGSKAWGSEREKTGEMNEQ